MKNLCIHILAAVMFAAAGISASAQEELDKMEPTQRRVDVQMDCGVGFMFRRHWELRAGYTFGLVDRLNGAYSHNFNLKQNQCYIGFGYRF